MIRSKEKEAWIAFKVLANLKASNYKLVVANIIDNFTIVGYLMRLKFHLMHNYLDYFPGNVGDVNS